MGARQAASAGGRDATRPPAARPASRRQQRLPNPARNLPPPRATPRAGGGGHVAPALPHHRSVPGRLHPARLHPDGWAGAGCWVLGGGEAARRCPARPCSGAKRRPAALAALQCPASCTSCHAHPHTPHSVPTTQSFARAGACMTSFQKRASARRPRASSPGRCACAWCARGGPAAAAAARLPACPAPQPAPRPPRRPRRALTGCAPRSRAAAGRGRRHRPALPAQALAAADRAPRRCAPAHEAGPGWRGRRRARAAGPLACVWGRGVEARCQPGTPGQVDTPPQPPALRPPLRPRRRCAAVKSPNLLVDEHGRCKVSGEHDVCLQRGFRRNERRFALQGLGRVDMIRTEAGRAGSWPCLPRPLTHATCPPAHPPTHLPQTSTSVSWWRLGPARGTAPAPPA